MEYSTFDNSFHACDNDVTNALNCANNSQCEEMNIEKSDGGPICCTGRTACQDSIKLHNSGLFDAVDPSAASFNNEYQVALRCDSYWACHASYTTDNTLYNNTNFTIDTITFSITSTVTCCFELITFLTFDCDRTIVAIPINTALPCITTFMISKILHV